VRSELLHLCTNHERWALSPALLNGYHLGMEVVAGSRVIIEKLS
jgi:hypothetical protein